MEFLKLNISDCEKDKALYINSFPKDERRLWQGIIDNLQKQEFDFYSVYSQGGFVAICAVWNFKDFVYVEYLAVDGSLRNKGIGSKILSLLKEKYAKDLVLEVEKPENAMAKKRIEFYKRNGFSLLEDFYMQPPYAEGLNELELKIMTTNPTIPFNTIKHTLHKEVYGVKQMI